MAFDLRSASEPVLTSDDISPMVHSVLKEAVPRGLYWEIFDEGSSILVVKGPRLEKMYVFQADGYGYHYEECSRVDYNDWQTDYEENYENLETLRGIVL